ncbi:hypothetical protein C0992_012487 [Termitomyces sp. T32_za158]|nr:hypothetical protein C0992_012487 [Termitomyces sp. T32_za158]
MTEYDFSPEAYERYMRGQHRIRRWVHHTDQTPKADPYQAATPAVDIPKELLPHSRLWDSNPPWSAQPEKKARKHRTHSEKEFDRERRNDWKYSHREHMDALRAGAAQTPTPRTKKASHDGAAAPRPPPPPQSRSPHTGSRYPADHRFSDSQDTSSSSEHVGANPPHPARKRSSSAQAPIRVPLPQPLPRSMPFGPLPGPMPLPKPTLFYVGGPEVNAQVVLDDEPAGKSSRQSSSRRSKPVPSQTHLPPPPASAPVYTSQGHNRYYSSSSPFLHQTPQGSQPRPAVAYPYPYAPSPLSPQNSAPAHSYPRFPAGFMPEPLKSSDRKVCRLFLPSQLYKLMLS